MIALADLFPKAHYKSICALCSIEGIADTDNPYGWRKFNQAQRILKHHQPSSTLTRSEVPGSDLPFAGHKRIGEKSASVISSYPLQFQFSGRWTDAINCIGNSVPPLFMRSIAHQIGQCLFGFQPMTTCDPSVNYVQFLDEAWQQHLKPRQPNASTVISLFAGCGGSSLGYSMAGYRELLAVEWDDNAIETFKLNFPDVPVYHGDIAELSVEDCLERTGLQVGELDILDGSPPCQGFSTAGKRVMDDPRNQLFQEYVRLLRGLKPKVFVMENVSGMVKGKMKLIFVEILKELKASGYRVSARLMNAMYFGVPQSRQRMIFIGVREDLDIEPSHPKAQSKPITVMEAWEGNLDSSDARRITDYVFPIWQQTPQGQSLEIGANKVLGKRNYYTHRKLNLNQPSNTIQKSIGSLIYHPIEPRGLSLSELKRIAGYPDCYQFINLSSGWARIGNSVPPMFMKAIADHIWQHILQPIKNLTTM